MCIPIFIPDNVPILGPVQKDGKQTINLYTKDGVRKTFIVSKEEVDTFVKDTHKSNVRTGCGVLGTLVGGLLSLTAFTEMRKPALGWTSAVIAGVSLLATINGIILGHDAQKRIIDLGNKQ